MKKKKLKKKLLKDIIIPAGAIFSDESGRTSYFGCGMFGTIIGLTRDSSGEFLYGIDKNDKELNEWFEDLT